MDRILDTPYGEEKRIKLGVVVTAVAKIMALYGNDTIEEVEDVILRRSPLDLIRDLVPLLRSGTSWTQERWQIPRVHTAWLARAWDAAELSLSR